MTTQLITPDLSTVPMPETLRPLLESALAIMEPEDPARPRVQVGICLGADDQTYYTVCFFACDPDTRRAFGSEKTAAATLEKFASKYKPLPNKSNLIAFHRAELAKLEASE